jgi:hypothetical protein
MFALHALTWYAYRFDPSQLLTIRVGKEPGQKDFVANESILTARSEFFRRAMNGSWEEAEIRVIKLPEDVPDVFANYLNFIYTGQFSVARKNREEVATLIGAEHTDYVCEEHAALLSVYVLAEKLQDVQAKNDAIRAVLDVTELKSANKGWAAPSLTTVNMTYHGTTEGSPARRLLVDIYSTMCISVLLGFIGDMHKEFRIDMGKILKRYAH